MTWEGAAEGWNESLAPGPVAGTNPQAMESLNFEFVVPRPSAERPTYSSWDEL